MAEVTQTLPWIFVDAVDLEGSAGVVLGPTPWFAITQDDVDTFAGVTRDWQRIHCDAEFSRTSTYGTTIAHGYFTLSLLSMFASQLYRVEKVDSVINYGIDSLRFPAIVPVGSRIRARATLLSTSPKGEMTLARVRYEVEVEGMTRPGLVAETTIALVPAVER
jgi:acyl dehydratase